MVNSLQILYSDDSIVAVVKPAGLLSQESDQEKITVPSLLRQELGGSIFPVHRLDRLTAGVMVYARTEKAAAALSAAIQNQKFQKEYLALVSRSPEEQEGIFEDLLFFDRSKNKSYPVKRERKGVKKAVLSYRAVEEKSGLCLLRIFPKTGRTHQIRVQFASRKMPLFGDIKYGGEGNGLALFCRKLTFFHPVTKEEVSFSALPSCSPPWDDFASHFNAIETAKAEPEMNLKDHTSKPD
jgi:23S rRNA pseudouridine1911/1915/1917 synthase